MPLARFANLIKVLADVVEDFCVFKPIPDIRVDFFGGRIEPNGYTSVYERLGVGIRGSKVVRDNADGR